MPARALFQVLDQQVVSLSDFPETFSLLLANVRGRAGVGIGMMRLGLVAKGRLGTTGLEIVEELVGQINFFAEQGPSGIEQFCFRI